MSNHKPNYKVFRMKKSDLPKGVISGVSLILYKGKRKTPYYYIILKYKEGWKIGGKSVYYKTQRDAIFYCL